MWIIYILIIIIGAVMFGPIIGGLFTSIAAGALIVVIAPIIYIINAKDEKESKRLEALILQAQQNSDFYNMFKYRDRLNELEGCMKTKREITIGVIVGLISGLFISYIIINS